MNGRSGPRESCYAAPKDSIAPTRFLCFVCVCVFLLFLSQYTDTTTTTETIKPATTQNSEKQNFYMSRTLLSLLAKILQTKNIPLFKKKRLVTHACGGTHATPSSPNDVKCDVSSNMVCHTHTHHIKRKKRT